jgi:hypothetical protein
MVCGLWLLFGKEHQRRCRRECFEWTEQLKICPNSVPCLVLQIAPFELRTKGIGATQFNVRFFARGDIRSGRMARSGRPGRLC